MEKNGENAIEFYTGDKKCTVSLTNQKYCNRIKKLYGKVPDQFDWFEVNADGSVYARIPLSWVKITPPQKSNLTDEQRREIAERLRNSRSSQKLISAQ